MRSVFMGNHDVGITVMNTLAELGVLAGVVAHPPDPEDGARYLSVFDRAAELRIPKLRAAGRDPELQEFITALAPDVLIVADYRYLLPASVIALVPFGAVNFHPSLLPFYRGRAPINWAILHGETELGLTAHLIDEGMDTGDVIAQRRYALSSEEDVGDALRKLYPLYRELTLEITAALTKGHLPCIPQDHARATTFPRRRPEDGHINFAAPAENVLNLVRAVAKPYPGAFAWCGATRVTLWKARLAIPTVKTDAQPGTVTQTFADGFRVACEQGTLEVLDWAADQAGWTPKAGQLLATEPTSRLRSERRT